MLRSSRAPCFRRIELRLQTASHDVGGFHSFSIYQGIKVGTRLAIINWIHWIKKVLLRLKDMFPGDENLECPPT